MAIEDLLRRGSNPWIVRRLLAGRSDEDIRADLAAHPNYEGETSQTYVAAIQQARNALANAADMLGLQAEVPLTAGEVRGRRPGWTAYRTTVEVETSDLGGGLPRRWTATIPSASPLSHNQLLVEIYAQLDQWRQEGRAGKPYGDIPQLFNVIIRDILTVERAAP